MSQVINIVIIDILNVIITVSVGKLNEDGRDGWIGDHIAVLSAELFALENRLGLG